MAENERKQKQRVADPLGLTLGKRMLSRRTFVGTKLAAGVAPGLSQGRADYSFNYSPAQADRLDQGPFGINQDDGWRTLSVTTPLKAPLRNFGLGLVEYTWEENGPALRVRRGLQTLEQAVEQMASLPFVDVLYIDATGDMFKQHRASWSSAPVWELTRDAARRHGLRFAFRVQLWNPQFEPKEIALPAFLRSKVPMVPIGHRQVDGRKPTSQNRGMTIQPFRARSAS